MFGKPNLALAKAKFRAWWEGAPFDEEAARAALDVGEPANDDELDKELFDEPEIAPPPRLVALAHLWGQGRIRPGEDAADALEPARLGASETGSIAVLGCGLAAPLIAFANAYQGAIECFEWREETLEALRRGLKRAKLDNRVTVSRIDLDAYAFQAETFDAIWSVDDFVYVGHPPHLAHQFARALKPEGCVMIETYVGEPSPLLATAFASSFAEPQVRTHAQVLEYFADFGLAVESDEDITEDFLDMARTGFKRLGASLTQAAALDVHAAQELAWEAEAWRTRLRLLSAGALQRRRIILRKLANPEVVEPPPAEDDALELNMTAAEPEPAPEAEFQPEPMELADEAPQVDAQLAEASELDEIDFDFSAKERSEDEGADGAQVLQRLLAEKEASEAKKRAKQGLS